MEPSPFRVHYRIQDTALYSKALGSLPEFSRGSTSPVEEYIWLAPVNGSTAKKLSPVATVRISGQTLEIESQSRKGIQALQVLIEELGGKNVQLISATSRDPKG